MSLVRTNANNYFVFNLIPSFLVGNNGTKTIISFLIVHLFLSFYFLAMFLKPTNDI